MWMTLDETATYLKVSKETIYKMAQKGKIPGSKLGNQWRFNQAIIDTWLEAQQPLPFQNNNNISSEADNGTK